MYLSSIREVLAALMQCVFVALDFKLLSTLATTAAEVFVSEQYVVQLVL